MTLRRWGTAGAHGAAGLGRTGGLGMVGGLGVVALAVAVAGCGSGGSSTSSTSSSSAASASSSAPSSSAAPNAAATSAAPTTAAPLPTAGGPNSSAAVNPDAASAGGPPGCATRDLGAAVGTTQGAAGSVYQVIDFTNIGTSSCSLYGFPGVALVGGSPLAQIGAAATRSTPPGPSLVTLAPGDTANVVLRITQAENYPTSTCHPVATTFLQIYPPNQTTPIYLAYKSTGCSATKVKLLSVGVAQAGKGSNGS